MTYLLLATDAHNGNVTVYWSLHGWTALRKHATGMTKAKANAKLAAFSTNPDIGDRFKDIVAVVQ